MFDEKTISRFWDKVNRRDAHECWMWNSTKDGNGYGFFKIKNRSIRAHRMMWSISNSKEIPEGMVICHSCDTPGCVNPAHLFVGTQLDNMRDCAEKGRMRKTHCLQGHALSDDNLVPSKYGKRVCRICHRIRGQKQNVKRRVEFHRVITHCPYGHEYTEDNSYFYKSGTRYCRTCCLKRNADRRALAKIALLKAKEPTND